MSVFLPREPHGQKSLAGYSPWGCKELDTTEQLSLIPGYTGSIWGGESQGREGNKEKYKLHGV